MTDSARRLKSVGWGITDRCNLSCRHCYSSASKTATGELTEDACLQVIDELKSLGTERIGWTGGEPLLRKDLEQLIAYARDRHGIQSGITTNGVLLNEGRVRAFRKADVKSLQISLDGSTAARNRTIRGASDKEFAKVIDGIRLAHDAGLSVHLAMLVARASLSDVRDFIDLATDMGVKSVRLCGFVPWGRGQNPEIRQEFDLTSRRHELKELVLELSSLSSPIVLFDPAFGPLPPHYYYHPCLAGVEMLYISANGNVYPCTSLLSERFLVGNLHDSSLSDIWNDPGMTKVSDYPRDGIDGPCATCPHFNRCHGACRGITYCRTGDMNASFPLCLSQVKPATTSSS